MTIERLKTWRVRCDGYRGGQYCDSEGTIQAVSRHDAYQQLANKGWRINGDESLYPHLCLWAHDATGPDDPVLFYERNPDYRPEES